MNEQLELAASSPYMHSAVVLAGIMARNGTMRNAWAAYFAHYDSDTQLEDIVERNMRRSIYSRRLAELGCLCGILPEHWDR